MAEQGHLVTCLGPGRDVVTADKRLALSAFGAMMRGRYACEQSYLGARTMAQS